MKKEIEVTVPFDTIKKIYPDGTVTLKKLKFTGHKIIKGYEPESDEERTARKGSVSGHGKRKETYAENVQDFRDRQMMRLRDGEPVDYTQEDGFMISCRESVLANHEEVTPEKLVLQEERRRQKVLYNIAKTRNKIFDIARSNDFNYFITLTFNAEKCDRYSFTECSKKVRQFMNNFMKYHKIDCPEFKYLLVHEQHKDGAYHYHGLIYLENTELLKYDALRSKQWGRSHKGQKLDIYNWSNWKNGFSTVSMIDNQEACRKYILKYISKNIDEDYQKGQRHFYYSQNCLKPEVESMVSDAQMLMLYDQIYDTDRSTGYESTLEKLDDYAGMIASLRYGVEV